MKLGGHRPLGPIRGSNKFSSRRQRPAFLQTVLFKSIMPTLSLSELASNLQIPIKKTTIGKVISLRGSLIVARLPDIAIGDICHISRRNQATLRAQAVSFENDLCFLAPFDELEGLSPNAEVKCYAELPSIVVAEHLIGTIIDPLGNPLNKKIDYIESELFSTTTKVPLYAAAPNPLSRIPIKEKLHCGIKSIDLFTPIGYGQRIGLFAGPGLGKSTLLGMLARNSKVDLTVIALVGERGREVNEFINDVLGAIGLKNSIVVVSTSNESPLRRVMAAQSATAIAEYFRAKGMRVMLIIDSLTRVARAIRDVSLAAGELPLRQGYTPSVYSELPKLLERAGNSDGGSITAIYSILTQNDESNDALGEEVKSLLDGHIILNGSIANEGIRPAIDILNSISRLKETLQNDKEKELCLTFLKILQRIRKDKDIVLMGGQADKELQVALELEESISKFLTQGPEQVYAAEESCEELDKIVSEFKRRMA